MTDDTTDGSQGAADAAPSPVRGRPPAAVGDLVAIATVARQYYLEGTSKVDIAQALGLSRFKVARMLEEALERGIVKIEISLPDAIDDALSTALGAAYGLRRAVVVDAPDEPLASLRADLGRVAATVVSDLVGEGDVVGVAWGRTLDAMAAQLTGLPRCTIVQLTGALSHSQVSSNAIELVRRMAQLAAGPAYPIYAPLMLDDPVTARSLRAQAQVATATGWYDRVDVAIVPIGSWVPPQSQLYDSLSDRERRQLLEQGVRADTSTVMLDEAGTIVDSPLSERMIGIRGDQLKAVPEVVAVAGGADKAEAVAATLRAGFVTTLITNSVVARALLDPSLDPVAT